MTLLGIPGDERQPGLGAVPPEEGSPPYVISDSRRADTGLEPSSATVLKAARTGSAQTTTRAEGGAKLAQAARPIFYQGRPSWVVVFSRAARRGRGQRVD